MSRPVFTVAVLLALTGASPTQAAEFTVTRVTVPEMKAVFGQVESTRVVPARARIGGSVREIVVNEGDPVKEGQVIAIIGDDKLTLERRAAKAKVDALTSQLKNARLDLDRALQLLERGVATQARVDQARTQFDVITNQIAAAEAEQAVVEQRAHEGEVLAPADGRILKVQVLLGSVVLSGDEIASVASGKYYLRLSLPERHAAGIKRDTLVRVVRRGVTVPEDGVVPQGQTGRIVKVYPEISGGRVIADVEVEGIGDFFVNERTLVWIPVAQRTAMFVPPQAVETIHGIDYVRVVSAGHVVTVAVILGEQMETPKGARIEVLSGLKEGDRLVVPD
ncbi:MAG: efflux RND transporter periplasmic adaptor subunit [Xanthobacteraceae bacterium]|nr:efflux RND transporter periplasmic adaptor subunit [Xanthobacteraceae bacterium]MCW5675592.1 efflux RND transporter periplasmic adaptor subunit [Xanthobacteraceae bacterium]